MYNSTLLYQKDETHYVREYAPQKRTVFFRRGIKTYPLYLLFPYMTFATGIHHLAVCCSLTPILGRETPVFKFPVGNTLGSFFICQPREYFGMYENQITKFWNTTFNSDAISEYTLPESFLPWTERLACFLGSTPYQCLDNHLAALRSWEKISRKKQAQKVLWKSFSRLSTQPFGNFMDDIEYQFEILG
jgi:hypothetical protein